MKIEDLKETLGRIPLGRTLVYQKIKDGTFPKPIKLGARRIGFISSEIDEWIAARIAESRPDMKAGMQ